MTDTTGAEIHQGSCLCGAVHWRVTGPLRSIIACHCHQCRKTSGHFAAMTSTPHDRFELIRDDGLAWYQSSAEARRGFCRTCGSSLFWQPTAEARIAIAAGTIDGPTGLAVARHIYCADKGDYYDLPADIPCLPEH